jgi:hypothetical protein
MTALQPSAKPADAVLSGQAGAAWGGGWSGAAADGWEGPCWSADGAPPRTRDASAKSAGLSLPYVSAIAMGATEGVTRVGAPVRSRLVAKCAAFALCRPRPSLWALLAPLVRRLDRLRHTHGALVGVHVRTGYPDWVALAAVRAANRSLNGSANGAWRRASGFARAAPLSHAEQWRTLESYLEQCPDDVAQLHGPQPHGPRTKPCFHWTYPNAAHAPTIADATRLCGSRSTCVRSQGCRVPAAAPPPHRSHGHGLEPAPHKPSAHDLALPTNGTLAAIVLCATRLVVPAPSNTSPTTVGAEQRAAAHWPGLRHGLQHGLRHGPALLVLGDAPGVVSLVQRLPTMDVVHTRSAGSLAHTQFDRACDAAATADLATARSAPSAHECAHGAVDPNGGWSRTMADFYAGGLVDAFVSALDTTFLDGAVLLRSLSCCAATARMHFSAASTAASNRDRPMESDGFLQVLMQEV